MVECYSAISMILVASPLGLLLGGVPAEERGIRLAPGLGALVAALGFLWTSLSPVRGVKSPDPRPKSYDWYGLENGPEIPEGACDESPLERRRKWSGAVRARPDYVSLRLPGITARFRGDNPTPKSTVRLIGRGCL